MKKAVSFPMKPNSMQVGIVCIDNELTGDKMKTFRAMMDDISVTVEIDGESGTANIVGITGVSAAWLVLCSNVLDPLVDGKGTADDKKAWEHIKRFIGSTSNTYDAAKPTTEMET